MNDVYEQNDRQSKALRCASNQESLVAALQKHDDDYSSTFSMKLSMKLVEHVDRKWPTRS